MKKQALIIFIRNPKLGKVKTRLAATVGAEAALEIYKSLLLHTHTITKDLSVDNFLWYADGVNANDIWENEIYHKEAQVEGDLGLKMSSAFQTIFNKGYESCCIIGSDCIELTQSILDDAFLYLQTHDIVIGPSIDGGYYLLGMNKQTPALFENIEWSTDSVFDDTVNTCRSLGLSLSQLPQLRDIDTEADWNNYLQKTQL